VRKRLYAAAPTERLAASTYDAESHARVYEACYALARRTLGAGVSVVLDAAFLDPAERAAARAVAEQAGAPFTGLWLDAPDDVLIARVAARTTDASDADAAVVRGQLRRDVGAVTWAAIDARGAPADVLAAVREALGACVGDAE
jgi:predicted kinase